MRRFYLLLLIVFPLASASAEMTDGARNDFEFAAQLYRSSLFSAARFHFSEYARRYDNERTPEALYWMAVCDDEMGETIAAVEDYSRAVDLLSGELRADAEERYAWALFTAGNYSDARERFHQVLIDNPDHPRAAALRYQEAYCLLSAERWEEAGESFSTFIEDFNDDPMEPMARYNLGLSLYRMEEISDAVEALTPIPALYPGTNAAVKAEGLLGEIFFRGGDYPSAREHYDRAFTLREDSDPEYLYWRAWAAIRGGDEDAGEEDLSELVDEFPLSDRRRDALFYLADRAIERGDTSTALARLDDARLEGSALDPGASYRLGSILYREGRLDEAARYLEEVTTAETGPIAEAYFLLGRMRFENNDPFAADLDFSRALEAGPPPDLVPSLLYQRLRSRILLGDLDAASSIAETLEESGSPYAAEAWLMRGEELEREGESSEAAESYRHVTETWPGTEWSEAAEYNLAVLEYRASEFSRAEAALSSFIEAHPSSEWGGRALYWLGWSRYRLERFRDAEEAFALCRDAAEEPLASRAALRAGNALYAAEDYEGALRWYDELIGGDTVTPEAREALFNRAVVLRLLGRHDDAVRAYLRAGNLAVDTGLAEEAAFAVGEVYSEAGSWADASRAFEAFAESFPSSPRRAAALMRAGEISILSGDSTAAERFFGLVAGDSGVSSSEAFYRLGELNRTRGDSDEAFSFFETAAYSFPASLFGRRARIRLDEMRADLGDTEAALDDLASFLESLGNAPILAAEIQLAAGRIHYLAGDTAGAEPLLDEALDGLEDPGLASAAKMILGRIYLAGGRWRDARRSFEFVFRGIDEIPPEARAESGLGLGVALEGMGLDSEAINVYHELVDRYGETVFGSRAGERLDELEEEDAH